MGVIDFHPSSDVAVVYLTEADLVGGYTYKSKLLNFAKVLKNCLGGCGSILLTLTFSLQENQ